MVVPLKMEQKTIP